MIDDPQENIAIAFEQLEKENAELCARVAELEAENAKLIQMHCSVCGSTEMYTCVDTGAQQCFECGTAFEPWKEKHDALAAQLEKVRALPKDIASKIDFTSGPPEARELLEGAIDAILEDKPIERGHWTRTQPTKPGWYLSYCQERRIEFLYVGKNRRMFGEGVSDWHVEQSIFERYWWSEPERLPDPPKEGDDD